MPKHVFKTLSREFEIHFNFDFVCLFIGFGHMTPSTFAGRLFCIFYALFGIPLCLLTLGVVGKRINELLENLLILISSKSQLRQDKSTKIKVLLATTGLVLVFLLLGGLLYLSEDWSYFDGVYYCFIGNYGPTKSFSLRWLRKTHNTDPNKIIAVWTEESYLILMKYDSG